eukprot:TRINITY_DN8610_c0_g1_i1.p3 TRINITY_DN8610_c0_g1~~TRINITY_DN8610_c0_g1_i1.p3  ORF type:complete len:104 (+),score=5.88 TRINITY_DN8610_c0_g1_i1:2121-2432(+)
MHTMQLTAQATQSPSSTCIATHNGEGVMAAPKSEAKIVFERYRANEVSGNHLIVCQLPAHVAQHLMLLWQRFVRQKRAPGASGPVNSEQQRKPVDDGLSAIDH